MTVWGGRAYLERPPAGRDGLARRAGTTSSLSPRPRHRRHEAAADAAEAPLGAGRPEKHGMGGKSMDRRAVVAAGLAAGALGAVARPARAAAVAPMVEHPFARANYLPDAPARAKVGAGKVVRGRVIAAGGGAPVPGARVEYYLNTRADAGPLGEQDEANRGQVIADAAGRFAFECDPPQRVLPGAAPHLHTRATAAGHAEFYYRHLTASEPSRDDVTIVLVPA